MKRCLASPVLVFLLAILSWANAAAQSGELPIGTIQGEEDVSPYRNQVVAFRGVVTGLHEDQNTRGIVYYTLFVQALPGQDDGDPATSDAMPVFTGRERPNIAIGSVVRVVGKVTEFYGFTEIDDDGLSVTVLEEDHPLPEPILIEPPRDNDAQLSYLEAFEGMRVTLGETVQVVGPAHAGCGFAVLAGQPPGSPELARVLRQTADDPVGQVMPVLYPSDVDCRAMPQVKTGDTVTGINGPLVYNFDQFKILLHESEILSVDPAPLPMPIPAHSAQGDQVSVVSFNLEDYFDVVGDTGLDSEPILLPEELGARQEKLARVFSELLRCPTIAGVQEVEHAELLQQLATELQPLCGFIYEVSHLESPDGRGIDNALLTDPRRVTVERIQLHQVCSPVPTEVVDSAVSCGEGESPLFGRPPLQVDLRIDGRLHSVFVNHFKSKRGGDAETALERLAQARYQNALVGLILDADPGARVIVLGDFNDNEDSNSRRTMTDVTRGGRLRSGLISLDPADRYTYNFGGVAELIDDVLVSPALVDEIHAAGIVHSNTDFPYDWRLASDPERLRYRVSDHDMPWLVLYDPPAPTATPSPPPTTTPEPTSTATLLPSATPTTQATPTSLASEAVSQLPTVMPVSEPQQSRSGPALWTLVAAIGGTALAALVLIWLRRRP